MPSNWTYKHLIDAVKLYADRYDAETDAGLYSAFVNLAEDRLNRIVRTRNMSERFSEVVMVPASGYDLDASFDGMRDIAINGKSLHYLNPEQFNNQALRTNSDMRYYTIIANQIELTKPTAVDDVIDMVFYIKIPHLELDTDTNWLLQQQGDIYVCAVCAEVESYVKNDQRAQLFWARLTGMFDELEKRDWKDRWSGNSLATRLETNNGT